jgi:hypothetical protein
MAYQITINSITSGTSPYDVWICNSCSGTCVYVDTTNTIPYSFTLPTVYETYPTYVVKIIDSNNCVYCEVASTTYKQFEDGEYFEFQDGEEYQFE